MTSPFVARGFRSLTGLWLVTSVLTGLPALLLVSFAEEVAARGAALLLLGSAGVALATAMVVGRGTRRALRISLSASALVTVAAGSALAVLASTGNVGPKGGLLFGGFAVGGAAVTATVAVSRLRGEAR